MNCYYVPVAKFLISDPVIKTALLKFDLNNIIYPIKTQFFTTAFSVVQQLIYGWYNVAH